MHILTSLFRPKDLILLFPHWSLFRDFCLAVTHLHIRISTWTLKAQSTHMRTYTQFFLFCFWILVYILKMSTYYILLLRSFVGQNFSTLTLHPGVCQPSGPVLLLQSSSVSHTVIWLLFSFPVVVGVTVIPKCTTQMVHRSMGCDEGRTYVFGREWTVTFVPLLWRHMTFSPPLPATLLLFVSNLCFPHPVLACLFLTTTWEHILYGFRTIIRFNLFPVLNFTTEWME